MKKPHGNTGKRNRALDDPRDARIFVLVRANVKAAAVQVFDKEKMPDFIELCMIKEIVLRDSELAKRSGLIEAIEKLEEKPVPLPQWTKGLLRRTAECLLSSGFTGKVEVRKANTEGFDFGKIPNFGSKCRDDLMRWL